MNIDIIFHNSNVCSRIKKLQLNNLSIIIADGENSPFDLPKLKDYLLDSNTPDTPLHISGQISSPEYLFRLRDIFRSLEIRSNKISLLIGQGLSSQMIPQFYIFQSLTNGGVYVETQINLLQKDKFKATLSNKEFDGNSYTFDDVNLNGIDFYKITTENQQ